MRLESDTDASILAMVLIALGFSLILSWIGLYNFGYNLGKYEQSQVQQVCKPMVK